MAEQAKQIATAATAVQSAADVIIVGAGIMGITTAYYLAQRGYKRILVLDRGTVGCGSTGLSVACIEPLSEIPCIATLQRHSIQIYQHFDEIIGGECGFERVPLAVFVGENGLKSVEYAATIARAAGSNAEVVPVDQFRQHAPNADFDGVGYVYTSPDGGYADPVLTLNSFASTAKAAGVVIRQSALVRQVDVSNGRATGVTLETGETLSAPNVLLAPGLWVEPLLSKLGLTASLSLLRHFLIFVEALPTMPFLSIVDGALTFYARPEKSGNLFLIGTWVTEGIFGPVHDPDATPPAISVNMAMRVMELMITRFPDLENMRLRPGSYSGIADITPDKQPLLGRLPYDGLYLAAGMNGVGFKMAPGIGQAMAGLIAGDSDCAELLAPLRPNRLQEGKLLVPEHSLSVIA